MLLKEIITSAGVSSCIIPFQRTTDCNANRTYSTPWNSTLYESYSLENVVLADFYSDGTTLSKSGTQ